jgi:hypothetical protein
MAYTPNQVIGAGLRDARIKIATGTEYDINGIVSIGGDPERDEVTVKGDDSTLGTFTMGMSETLSIEANSLTFDVIQQITGNAAANIMQSSTVVGKEVALGTDSEMNPPVVEVQAFTTALSVDNTKSYIQKVWHKVQLTNVRVTQAGEAEFKLLADGRAFQTSTDITGASLTSRRISTVRTKSGDIPALAP